MENVLTALIALFVMLFAAFTLSNVFYTAQDSLRVAWQQMEDRMTAQARTHLTTVESRVFDAGNTAEFVFRNDGSARLTDFKKWDAIAQYTDEFSNALYHMAWLPYTAINLSGGQWTKAGIYLDAHHFIPEVYEPGILNPGEEIVLQVKVSPAIGLSKIIQVTFTTPNGTNVVATALRNQPPQLIGNVGLIPTAGSEISPISQARLAATDPDDPPDRLIYTVISGPTQGTLNLGMSFTQVAINNGLLRYTHTGAGNDSFTFTVSDGKTSIGPYVFDITIDSAPMLATNTGLVIADNAAQTIGRAALSANDASDPAEHLTYMVMVAPVHGTLNLGSAFTQSAIDDGQLTYIPTSGGNDSFTFTISDGKNIVGPYTFTITNP